MLQNNDDYKIDSTEEFKQFGFEKPSHVVVIDRSYGILIKNRRFRRKR